MHAKGESLETIPQLEVFLFGAEVLVRGVIEELILPGRRMSSTFPSTFTPLPDVLLKSSVSVPGRHGRRGCRRCGPCRATESVFARHRVHDKEISPAAQMNVADPVTVESSTCT